MHFQFSVALLGPVLATFALAAPTNDTTSRSFSKRGLPDHCAYILAKAVKYTPPSVTDQSALFAITSKLPNSCGPEAGNPMHIVCHVPGEPACFTSPTKRTVAKDNFYELTIKWKRDAIADYEMENRAVVKDNSYELTIERKRDAIAGYETAKCTVAKDSPYKLTIKWS